MPPLFVPATAAPDAGPGIAKQTALTLARLDERLRAEHSSLADALAVTVYLRRAADFAAMNDEYRQAFRGTPPTRTTIVTEPLGAADEAALVEMSPSIRPRGPVRRIHIRTRFDPASCCSCRVSSRATAATTR
jgi:endoribonuclease L-PSP